jgi:hypothetical protein
VTIVELQIGALEYTRERIANIIIERQRSEACFSRGWLVYGQLCHAADLILDAKLDTKRK